MSEQTPAAWEWLKTELAQVLGDDRAAALLEEYIRRLHIDHETHRSRRRLRR